MRAGSRCCMPARRSTKQPEEISHDLVQARTQGLKVAINTRKIHCLDMPNRTEREFVTLLWRTQH